MAGCLRKEKKEKNLFLSSEYLSTSQFLWFLRIFFKASIHFYILMDVRTFFSLVVFNLIVLFYSYKWQLSCLKSPGGFLLS